MATNTSSRNSVYSTIWAWNTQTNTNVNVDTTNKTTEGKEKQQFVWEDIATKAWLTRADAQEFKDTWAYSTDAQTKIDAYKKQREVDNRTTIDTAKDIVTQTQEAWKTLEETTKQQQADAEANKTTDISLAEKQAQETADLLKRQNDALAIKEAQTKTRLEEEKQSELDNLKKKQSLEEEMANAEREKLSAEAEYQRIQNQNAIIEANKNIEIQRQQSAWAYQKLWLWFSSWIINQSQQIATDWIAKIAEIKAKMNYNEAMTWVEQSKINTQLKQIEIEYAWLINTTISSYSDKLDDLDTNAEKRIQDLTKNLLLNNQQKDTKINEVLKEYRNQKTTLERQHIDDMMKIQDRWFTYQKEVEAQVEKQKEVKLTNLSEELLNWTLAWMSAIEISKREDELWLPRWTINQKMDWLIRQWIRWMVDVTIWKDYIIWDIEYLKSQIVTQMKQWRTLWEAVDIIWGNYIKNNSEYKKIQANKYTKKTTSWWSGSNTASTASTSWQLISDVFETYWVKLDSTTANSLIKWWEDAVRQYYSWLTKKQKENMSIKQQEADKKNTKTNLEIEKSISKFKWEYDNTKLAEDAYEKLIQSWKTKKEAFEILASQNKDLILEKTNGWYKLTDWDFLVNDEVLNR